MKNENFICPNCGAMFNRNKQYFAILQAQNTINKIMGNKNIKDLCGNCNYFEEEEQYAF